MLSVDQLLDSNRNFGIDFRDGQIYGCQFHIRILIHWTLLLIRYWRWKISETLHEHLAARLCVDIICRKGLSRHRWQWLIKRGRILLISLLIGKSQKCSTHGDVSTILIKHHLATRLVPTWGRYVITLDPIFSTYSTRKAFYSILKSSEIKASSC